MLDLDSIEEKEDVVSKITSEVVTAFASGGKNQAIVAFTKRVSDIRELSKVDWIRLKAEANSVVGMKEKDLADIRKRPVVSISTGWEIDLDMDSTGGTKGGLKNCNIILSSHERIKGRIRWNDFLKRPVITESVPFLKGVVVDENGWIEIDENVMPQLRSWLAMDYAEFGKDCLSDAVTNVSLHDSFNPLTSLLDSCADNWDQKPRLDDWLHYLCGAEKSEYASAVGSKWMISAVARAYEPGCKVDTMLILEGGQGVGKSSFLRELSFGYFLELLTDISKGKDVVDKMLGKWIIEMPELKALSGDREANKAFLTQQVDSERLSYARRSQGYPRRCVFIGTTNEDSYLKDDTGERRYWPVVVDKCDKEKLKPCLSHLWGEAVIRYRKGEKWWLEDQSMIDAAISAQSDKSESDEMESLVKEFIEGREKVFSLDVWLDVFGGRKDSFDKSVQMRVAKILKKLGLKRNLKDKSWTI